MSPAKRYWRFRSGTLLVLVFMFWNDSACFLCDAQIRTELEMNMTCNLREFKEFIDNEMIVILGQMDSPTEIFEHVFLVGFSLLACCTPPRNMLHFSLKS